MKTTEIEESIRNFWFKDHIAKYTKLNDRISVLDWGKPGTICYYVRYVFDGYWLYISGDLDEAVFGFSSEINHPSNFTDTGLGYFHRNLSAYHDEVWGFDSEKAKKEIIEKYKYLRKEQEISKDELEFFREMIEFIDGCSSVNEWTNTFNYSWVSDLYDIDSDYWEWIYGIGNDYPSRIRAYLIGLKMAAEQLGDDE